MKKVKFIIGLSLFIAFVLAMWWSPFGKPVVWAWTVVGVLGLILVKLSFKKEKEDKK